MTQQINTAQNIALEIVDYSNHTFHMKRARNYSYNYATIDGILMEVYHDHTIKEIASTLNEPFNRVVYRVQFIQKNHPAHIVRKYGKGATVNKGTYNVTKSNVGQSKRKANG